MVIFAVLYLQPQSHPYRVNINYAVFLHKLLIYVVMEMCVIVTHLMFILFVLFVINCNIVVTFTEYHRV